MSVAWKTIPLFISSTFRDMHAERDRLNNVVFPALQEKLRERRCRLEPIDLRVGVETAATQTERERELQILKVCLAEIERSRPFLLVLLGDRYGWVPGEDRIRAAAAEAGFTAADAGASVTALEIEYGLLKRDAAQRRRCLLSLRAPFPYDIMPAETAAIYSDAHAKDSGAADRVRRLEALKSAIQANPELKAHCRVYHIAWDEERQAPAPNVIAAWGHSVEAELWKLLDEETRDRVSAAEPTWQEDERFALEEMVERLGDSFVGRTALLQRVMDMARSPACEGAPWGLCLTGASGAGKSALFARLHQKLSESGVLLLANAAGISQRSGQVAWMLRRWIGELGAALGERPDVPEDIKAQDLEQLFAQWLHRASASRRVVLLVDALNQFSFADGARNLAWLPASWPANARLVVTAIPGQETDLLSRRDGVTLVEVPTLDLREAAAVMEQVYARFHRQPNAEVLVELMALRAKDGTPSAGNPLWLTLALDLLNQLDADDFSAVEAAASGSAEEKLRRYVIARARSLPPDIGGLYGELLARVEKIAGRAEARGFAAALALSRNGWREEDLMKLLPIFAYLMEQEGLVWDPLHFAMLRRCFRGHLVKRGALEQWDFAHGTLREAVLSRLGTEWHGWLLDDLTRVLCRGCANHLETLHYFDPLRASETMYFLLKLGERDRAAKHVAELKMDGVAEVGPMSHAVFTLVEAIQSAPDEAARDALTDWITSFLEGGDDRRTQGAAGFLIDGLDDGLAAVGRRASTSVREKLLDAALHALQREADSWAEGQAAADSASIPTGWAPIAPQGTMSPEERLDAQIRQLATMNAFLREYSRSLMATARSKLGGLRNARGDLAGALESFQQSQKIQMGLHQQQPILPNDIANQLNIAGVLLSSGDVAGAMTMYQTVHDTVERFAVFAEVKQLLVLAKNGMGDVLMAQGNIGAALGRFREALEICESTAADEAQKSPFVKMPPEAGDEDWDGAVDRDAAMVERLRKSDSSRTRSDSSPTDEQWQRIIAQTYDKIGGAYLTAGDFGGALAACGKAESILQALAAANPARLEWQHRLGILLRKMVVAHYGLEQPEEAIEAAQRSCAFLERKLAADPTPQSRYDLAMSQGWLADAFTMAGRYQEALAIHRSLVRDFEELVAKDDSDPQWADFLEMSRDRVQSMEAAFRTLAEKEPNSPLLAPVVPASKQAAPMPEDLRQSADNYMKRGLWEAAATVLEKLLAQGAPVAECGPKLVTCLLSAHAEVLPGDAEKIEKLAAQLDAAGHAAEAAEVRAQLAARQFNPPPRPWWKLW